MLKSCFQRNRAAVDLPYFARTFCRTVTGGDMDSVMMPYPDPMEGPYSYLKPYYEAFMRGDELIIWEKLRQVLGSWTVVLSFLWSILYEPYKTYAIVSESADSVDDNSTDQNSLFGKLRVLIDHMPQDVVCDLDIKYMSVHNPAMQSTIKGFPGKKNAGRGPSWAGCLLDEAAHIWYGEQIWTGIKSACPKRKILLSTPNPECDIGDDLFSRLRWSETAHPTIITTTIEDHPERDAEWLAKESEDMTQSAIDSQLLVRYGRSLTGRCFWGWKRKEMLVPVKYIPGAPVFRTWDFGWGTTAIITGQFGTVTSALTGKALPQARIIDYYEASQQPYWHYRDHLAKDPDRFPSSKIFDIGDPWMQESHESTGYTWGINLAKVKPEHPYRIYVRPARVTKTSTTVMIDNVLLFMTMVQTEDDGEVSRFVIDEDLKVLGQHVEGYVRPTTRAGVVRSDKPSKDQHSHPCDAIQYWIYDQHPPKPITQMPVGKLLVVPKDSGLVELERAMPSLVHASSAQSITEEWIT